MPLLYPTLTDVDVANRAVLMRVDFNIPATADGRLADTWRLEAHVPGIQTLLAKGARLGLLTHRGRPQGDMVPELSTRPLAEALSVLLGQEVGFVPDCVGRVAEQAMAALAPGQVLLFENTRFHMGEQINHAPFVRELARLGEVFVNDAFAAAHRPHASMSGLAAAMRPASVLGPRMVQELEWLEALQRPQAGRVVVLGGAQVPAKLDLIEYLMTRVDTLILAGPVAHTFLASRDMGLGRSLLDPSSVERARGIFTEAGVVGCRLLLPQDTIVANKRSGEVSVKPSNKLEADDMAMDIGPATVATWSKVMGQAQSLLWLGSVGAFETPPFQQGTLALADGLLFSPAFSVVAGDGLVRALKDGRIRDRLPHVSSGGAVWMNALGGVPLPSLRVLDTKQTA